ncbi:MAG: response regulator [Burkholderiaceae bacterium]|jgi:two-component system nitrate/nitrite response regulator NarL|nr:response regulator [Burkholderiaceae bacterium]
MNTDAPIRILVVDDHTLFRRGLIALLAAQPGMQVVAEAGDAGEAQRRALQLKPDVILLDNDLPGVKGIDALPGLREAAPKARILMLTVSEEAEDLATALMRGASGYLLKTVDTEVLAESIMRVHRNESPISPEMTGKLATAYQTLREGTVAQQPAVVQSDPIDSLSPREQQILAEIARGASNKEIARVFSIAEATVKIHVQHILRKLNLNSRVQAAVYATRLLDAGGAAGKTAT